jgi:hypothetical protein
MTNEVTEVDVVICTPGSSLMIPYVKSFLATIEELTKRGMRWAFSSEYSSHVADAREITASGTYSNDINDSRPFHGKLKYKKLFWIDSDIAWTVEDFFKLYDSDKDIISGAYLLGNGEVTAYPQKLGRALTYTEVLEMKDPIKVHGTGFGFLAVKQGVFESLSRPWFQSAPVTMTDANTKQEYTFPIMGEDISWCERVNNLGYEVWFDPTVKLTHHKTMKLTWEGIRP